MTVATGREALSRLSKHGQKLVGYMDSGDNLHEGGQMCDYQGHMGRSGFEAGFL